MHRELGIDTELVPENEWQQRFPWANLDGVGAIVFERSSGYADPVQNRRSVRRPRSSAPAASSGPALRFVH